MGRSSRAQVPRLAVEISATWEPDERLQNNRTVRGLDEGTLPELVVAFREFCLKHKLKRTVWGHTFVNWLQRRHDPNWAPKELTDIWV